MGPTNPYSSLSSVHSLLGQLAAKPKQPNKKSIEELLQTTYKLDKGFYSRIT
jgi:hypothetical protein